VGIIIRRSIYPYLDIDFIDYRFIHIKETN
jgi:hypothetical protein